MKAALTLMMFLASGTWIMAIPTTDVILADPQEQPVSIDNLKPGDHNCNGEIFTEVDVRATVMYGVLLQEDGQTRGRNMCPEEFTMNPTGVNLMFPTYCPGGDVNRHSYPILMGTYYNGGTRNRKQGQARAVYMHSPNERDPVTMHYKANFCGLMYHTGGTPNGFARCVAA